MSFPGVPKTPCRALIKFERRRVLGATYCGMLANCALDVARYSIDMVFGHRVKPCHIRSLSEGNKGSKLFAPGPDATGARSGALPL